MFPKKILILGTLDTKEEEILFLKERIEKRGHKTLVMDAGIRGKPAVKPDISRQEVALAGGKSLEKMLSSGDKGACIENMIRGTRKIVKELFRQRRFDGMIGIGGAQGAVIGTTAMRMIPFGVPKIMVTTVASGRACFGDFVGTADLTMMHSVVDLFGVNSLSAKILSNAAGAIAGMVEATDEIPCSGNRPKIGLTVLGNTTPAGMKIKKLLIEKGYEVIPFHCNGTGGMAMEGLIAEGYFDAVLDLTTHEIIDREYGGLHGAVDSSRLEAAGRTGTPQVVVPGCIDYLVFGPLEKIPKRFKGRKYVVHNPQITLVRASRREMVHAAEVMARKLNKAGGPVAMVIPLRGLSMHNVPGGPFFEPETDRRCCKVFRENLRSDIPIYEVDSHINDPVFAEAVVRVLLETKESQKPKGEI